MHRLRAAAGRHPRIADALFAAALAGVFARLAAADGGMPAGDWVWFAALYLPLVWRRAAPVTVFWTVVTLAFAAVTAGMSGPSLLVVPMVAGYALARHRPRRALRPVVLPVAVFAAGWLAHGGPAWDAALLIGAFAGALLLGSNIRTRQAYLAEQARLVVATERARIAREMHDIVAHNLAVMVALSDGAAATAPADPGRAVELMEQASATGREALTEIRRLVGVLRDSGSPPEAGVVRDSGSPPEASVVRDSGSPPEASVVRDSGSPPEAGVVPKAGRVPVPQPGFADIDRLIDQVRAAGLPVTAVREGTPGPWGPGAGLAVYRIVQEALTNTMRHAGPLATAEVRLRYHQAGAEVDVIDDGRGGHPTGDRTTSDRTTGGHGLAGMAERVAPFGGRVTAGPRPDRGWHVQAHLPLGTEPR